MRRTLLGRIPRRRRRELAVAAVPVAIETPAEPPEAGRELSPAERFQQAIASINATLERMEHRLLGAQDDEDG